MPDDTATPAADPPETAADPPATASAALAARMVLRFRREPWVDAGLPTALLRGVVLVYAFLAIITLEAEALGARSFLDIWDRWDAPHFFEVARDGYVDPARIVLFPLLPALIRIGSVVTSPLVAGMVISFIATLAAAAGLHRLIRMDHARPIARWGVLAMSIFPTAFTLVAPYPEGPFLA